MPVRVVDASALAALIFGEPRSEEVARMLGNFDLAAPTLLRYEIGSVCFKKIRANPKDRDLFLDSLGLFDEIGVREIEVPIDPIVEIAEAMGLSTYDASYLWLSRALEVPLVTLDQKLLQASTT